jgi:carbon storage regulator
MLFLTRKVGESIVINDDIEVTVVEVRGRSIKLGFTFPPEAKVLRRELHDRIKAEAQGGQAGDPTVNGAALDPKSTT